MVQAQKQCYACRETKPLSEFYGDGSKTSCKPCFRQAQRLRNQRHLDVNDPAVRSAYSLAEAENGLLVRSCSKCGQTKPLEHYMRGKRIDSRCKACNAQHTAKRRKDPAKYAHDRAVAKVAYYANLENNRRRAHDSITRRLYGLTLDDVRKGREERGHKCDICKRRADGHGSAALAVDHCHKTGALRGFLCTPCNRALGLFGDDTQRLERAISYLRRSKCKVV